jgi:hypothetical protein
MRLGVQRALGTEPWGEAAIRMRMGIHTGEGEQRDGSCLLDPEPLVQHTLRATMI